MLVFSLLMIMMMINWEANNIQERNLLIGIIN